MIVQKFYQELEKLYYAAAKDDCYRHLYSDIFLVLTQIQQGNMPGSIDVLGQNILEIRKGYQAANYDADGNLIDISDSIRKLYDHVSLEVARIGYLDAEIRNWSGEEKITDLQAQVNSVKTDIVKAEELQDVVCDKLDHSQKEYITILGIFAAVVLTFTGGIAFSTSVLDNIAQASVYRILIVTLIMGLVLINVLFGLFYYVNKLVNRENKIEPLIISNVILLLLVAVTVIAWNYGWVETRDIKVNGSDSNISISAEAVTSTEQTE